MAANPTKYPTECITTDKASPHCSNRDGGDMVGGGGGGVLCSLVDAVAVATVGGEERRLSFAPRYRSNPSTKVAIATVQGKMFLFV